MRFIFMILILFLLVDPVMAKPINNTSECLNMYGHYMEEYGSSQLIPDAQMRNFIGRCLPDDTLNNSISSATDKQNSRPKNLLHHIETIKNQPIKI